MGNTYTDLLKLRIPAAGDTGWADEFRDDINIIEFAMVGLLGLNYVTSGLVVSDAGGLYVSYTAGVIYLSGSAGSVSNSTHLLKDNSINYLYIDSNSVFTDSRNLPTGSFIPVAVVDVTAGNITRIGDCRNTVEGTAGDIDISGTPAENDIARFVDADTIEGRSYSELKGDLDLEIGTDILAQQTIGIADNNLLEMDDAGPANEGEYVRLTADGLEGRTDAEVKEDLDLEIGTDLQAHDAKTAKYDEAQTWEAAQNFADNNLQRANLLDCGIVTNAIGAIGGGAQTIDIVSGNSVSGTVDTSETTFTFSNPTASDELCVFSLVLTNGGSQTVNWPASVDFAGGTAPTLTTSGVDILVFATIDGGTIWHGSTFALDSQSP